MLAKGPYCCIQILRIPFKHAKYWKVPYYKIHHCMPQVSWVVNSTIYKDFRKLLCLIAKWNLRNTTWPVRVAALMNDRVREYLVDEYQMIYYPRVAGYPIIQWNVIHFRQMSQPLWYVVTWVINTQSVYLLISICLTFTCAYFWKYLTSSSYHYISKPWIAKGALYAQSHYR